LKAEYLTGERDPTCSNQGCQIFLGATYQNRKNIPKWGEIYLPKGHIVYQMAIKYTKWL
jgi:hypothetical protein